MRVAIVNRHPVDYLGGSETQCDNIAKGLSQRGHDVTYVAPSGGLKTNYDRQYSVFPVEARSRAIVDVISRSSPDLVYWRFNKYCLLGSAKGIRRLGIPFVFAISHINDTKRLSHLENPRLSMMHALRAAKQSVESAINFEGFSYVDAVTSLNPDLLGKLPVSDQTMVPNSVELELTQFKWPRPYVVWIANLKAAKRPELYIKLAEELRESAVDFLLVGEIVSSDYDFVNHFSDISNLFYLGKRSLSETNGIIKGSTALIHTCLPEGFGNNFIQAWSLGIPTISFSFDPGGFISEYGLGGFARGDWNTFRQLVLLSVESEGWRSENGKRALEFSRNFSIDKTVSILEGLFKRLLATHSLRKGLHLVGES